MTIFLFLLFFSKARQRRTGLALMNLLEPSLPAGRQALGKSYSNLILLYHEFSRLSYFVIRNKFNNRVSYFNFHFQT